MNNSTKDDARNILTSRIQQARSIVGSLTYSGGDKLSHEEVNNIIWGVTELLDQALEASHYVTNAQPYSPTLSENVDVKAH